MVIVPADCATVLIPAPAIVVVPPPAPPAALSVITPVVVPVTVNVCASFVTLPSTSVPVMVILPPFVDMLSVIAFIPAALIVTPVAPVVFDVITEDVVLPALTPIMPSFVTLPSTSVPVMVIVPADCATVLIPAPAIVVLPPPVPAI